METKYKIKNDNDVLLLVYEAYSDYETMKYYGFDNSEQLFFLEENGFYIYHGTYSLGTPTMPSMSQVFNLEREVSDVIFLAGGGVTHKIFAKQNYKTVGIFFSDYFFRGLSIDKINYDFTFPEPYLLEGAKLIITAILYGEFSDKVSLERNRFDSFIDQKRYALMKEYQSPVFMYSHSGSPGHRPSLAQCPNDVDKYINIYLDRVKSANIEMKEDISKVLTYNQDAIVIIAGDHGPFLTKTGYGVHMRPDNYSADDIDRLDIQDRYGSFLAIRWPEKKYYKKHDIKILQDIFPAVFSYLYDDNAMFEKTRIQQRSTVGKSVFGVYVEDGIIVGGKDDGKPLFKGIQ